MHSGARPHGCCWALRVGPTLGILTLAAQSLAMATTITHPIPGQLLAKMMTFKPLSGYKKEVERNSIFVLGASWLPLPSSSPS